MNATVKQKKRKAFEFETWHWANKRQSYQTTLFDAGALGYCLLRWSGSNWYNEWFDRLEKIPKANP